MTTLHSYFDSVPQENRCRLDRTLDFDHNGVPEDLGRIASSVDQWEGRVADELKLTNTEVAAIRTLYPGQLNLQTRAALQKWQEKFGLEATYRNLITVFVNAGKGSYAEAVCRVLGAKFDDSQQGYQGVFHNQGVEDDPLMGTSGTSLSCDPQTLSGDQEYRLHPSQGYTIADQRSSREPLNQFQNTGPQSYYQQTSSLPPFPTVNTDTQQLLVPENTNTNQCHLFRQSSRIQDGSYQPSQVVENTSTDQRNLRESVNQIQNTGSHMYHQQISSFHPLRTVNPHTQHPRVPQRVPSAPHPYQLFNLPQMVEPHTHLEPLHYPNIPNPRMRPQTPNTRQNTPSSSVPVQMGIDQNQRQLPKHSLGGYYHPSQVVESHTQIRIPPGSHHSLRYPPVHQAVKSNVCSRLRVVSDSAQPLRCSPIAQSRYLHPSVNSHTWDRIPPGSHHSLRYPPVGQAVQSNIPRVVSSSAQSLWCSPIAQPRYVHANVNTHYPPNPLDHQFQGTTVQHQQLPSIPRPYVDSLLAYHEPPSCKRMKYNEQETPPTPAITRYANYLRGVYSGAKVCSDKFLEISCEKFISLALIKKERISRSEADKFTEATLHGDIDEILKKKEPIEMEDILKPTEEQHRMKCVFVEGAPGVGKSTFCWEFCRRWDEIEVLKKFKLVYLLRLRDKRVQETQTVSDLFYHEDCKLSMDVASEVLQCEGRGVLLVLDGFDELPVSLQKSSLFVRLIQGSCLSHCTVLVTSRPSATADLLSVARPQINKQVELLGFTQENIEEYARSIFSSQANNMLTDFLKYISVNPAIRSMMYIPLNSAIVVEVYRANKTTDSPIPQTMTQLYSELCNVLLRRHLFDRGDPLAEDIPGLEHITPQHKLYEPLCVLAKLAYEGIERQKVIFDKLPDGCDHFSFMNASSELYLGRKGRVSYSFLHLTLQEFLAAFYISQLPADSQRQFFDKYGHDKVHQIRQMLFSDNKQCGHKQDVVWRFVAGLTGFKGIENAWKLFEDMQRHLRPFNIQCLYEAQDKVDFNSVFPESKVVSYVNYDMQLFDYYALGYCVSASRCKWELKMGTNGFVDGGELEMLSYQLQDRGENIVSLHIDYSVCTCSPTFVECLAQLILNTVKLKKFILFVYELSFECLQLLAKSVFSSSSLNRVEIGVIWDKWDLSSGINPFTPLEDNHNIEQLILFDFSLKSIPNLAKALHKNTALISLHVGESDEEFIEYNDLTTTSVTALSEMIKVNHTLEQLVITHLEVTREDILTLNKALQHNTTLKQLELQRIEVKDCSDLAKLNELDPRISNNIENNGLRPSEYFEDDSEQEEDKEEA